MFRGCWPAAAAILTIIPRVEAEILLVEDFSQPLAANWTLYGEPQPVKCDSMGLPPPSFDNNGDTLYNSGIISRRRFDYVNGLAVECDMYVTSNERGAWITGSIGLSFNEEALGVDGETPYDICFSYAYSGEADWQRPHLEGILSARVKFPDGTREDFTLLHLNDYLDSWHRFGIVIGKDLRVAFQVDSVQLYITEKPLPRDLGELVVMLGDRSGLFGRVFHDNVVVRTP